MLAPQSGRDRGEARRACRCGAAGTAPAASGFAAARAGGASAPEEHAHERLERGAGVAADERLVQSRHVGQQALEARLHAGGVRAPSARGRAAGALEGGAWGRAGTASRLSTKGGVPLAHGGGGRGQVSLRADISTISYRAEEPCAAPERRAEPQAFLDSHEDAGLCRDAISFRRDHRAGPAHRR